MYALGLSFILFVFFCLIGKPVLGALVPRLGVLKSWLLAPSMGLSLLLLGLMVGNEAGLPIRSFAAIWLLTLSAAAGWLYYRQGRQAWLGLPKLTPYFGLFAAFLLLAGWPAFEFGFKWVSYVNDDMANYCLAAERFMDRPFFQVPTNEELNLTDYTQNYWYMHGTDLMRFGSEHLLAWLGVVTGSKALSIFMPTILTLGGVQLFAAGGLILFKGRFRLWALLGTAILAISPLFALSTLYQLIAQVGGLGIMMSVLALTLTREPSAPRRFGGTFREALAIALPSSALCIYYPEVTPFAVLTAGGYVFVHAARSRQIPWTLIRRGIYALAATFVILNYNLISYVYTLTNQTGVIANKVDLSLSLFPFFLLPTGTANLFGLLPISVAYPEPLLSLMIAVGLIGVVTALAIFVWGSLKTYPIAILGLVQAFLAYRLFVSGNDFGLFKIALFLQPALAAAGAWFLLKLTSRKWLLGILLVLYGAAVFPTTLFYSKSSCGNRGGNITELRLASKLGVKIEEEIPKSAKIVSTIDNVVAGKLAAGELRGHELSFASRDFFSPAVRINWRVPDYILLRHPFAHCMLQTPKLLDARKTEFNRTALIWNTTFTYPVGSDQADYYLTMSPKFSLFNKYNEEPNAPVDRLFRLVPANQVHNMLVFVHSIRGNHYYLGDRRRIALFQQEQDEAQKDLEFTGIGRFLLMKVVNPSEEIYLRVAATRTYMPLRSSWQDTAVIQGAKDYPMGLFGSGAFNKIIGPLRPRYIDGSAYVAIDFHDFPQPMADYRTGLMKLYSRDVPRDFRRLAAWGRDISALSPSEYAAVERPRSVSRFPQDITLAKGLEFTGVYEDGWIGARSSWTLAKAERGEWISIQGLIPGFDDLVLKDDSISLRVNGQPISRIKAQKGYFNISAPIPYTGAPTKLELEFTKSFFLPNLDGRPVAAMLNRIDIVEADKPAGSFEPASNQGIKNCGIDTDGWMNREAWLGVAASRSARTLVIDGEFPGWDGGSEAVLEAQLSEGETRKYPLKPGKASIALSLPASETPITIRLTCSREFAIPAPDGRIRSLYVGNIKLTPLP